MPKNNELWYAEIHYVFTFTGNGYIEGRELDNFLREFVSSVNATDIGPEVWHKLDSQNFKILKFFRLLPIQCLPSLRSVSWRRTTTIEMAKSKFVK